MKLLKLETRNIASLVGDNTIDFEQGPLGESAIFGIVGPTGSGKSTILDAICLALYGNAPRYPRMQRQQQRIEIYGDLDEEEKRRLAPTDPRNILTRGKSECFCQLTFLASDGQKYLSRWSVRFPRVQFESAVLTLSRWEDGVLVPLPDLKAADVVGLDYQQFLRTVVLAQGSFASFLMAKEEERYTLLEKIVGNGDFYKRIAAEVKQRMDEARTTLDGLKAQCGAYLSQQLSPDTLEAEQGRLAELEAKQEQQRQEAAQLDAALRWHAEANRLDEATRQAAGRLDAARTAAEQMRPEAERLALHDAAQPAVRMYSALVATRRAILTAAEAQSQLAVSLQTATVEAEAAAAVLLERNAALDAAERELRRQQPHILQARILASEVQHAATLTAARTADVAAARQAHQRADEAVRSNTKALRQAETALTEATRARADEEAAAAQREQQLQQDLTAAQDAHASQQALLSAVRPEQLQQDLTAAQRAEDDLRHAVACRRSLREKAAELDKTLGRQAELEAQNEELARRLGALTIDRLRADVLALRRAETLMNSTDWAHQRADLQDGSPCPLCGATSHPYASAPALQLAQRELNQRLQQAERELAQQDEERDRCLQTQQNNRGQLQALAAAVPLVRRELAQLDEEWALVAEAHPDWQADEAWLAAQQPRLTQQADEARARMQQYNDTATRERELHQAMAAAAEAMARFVRDKALRHTARVEAQNAARTRLETLQGLTAPLGAQLAEKAEQAEAAQAALMQAEGQLAELRRRLHSEFGDRHPDDVERQLMTAIETARKQEIQQRDVVAGAQGRKRDLEGRYEAGAEAAEQRAAQAARELEDLDRWLAAYNTAHEDSTPLTEAVVAALERETTDWEALRARQDRLRQALTEAETTHRGAVAAAEEHRQGQPAYDREAAEARCRALAAEQEETATLQASLRLRLQQHREAEQKLGALAAQTEEAEAQFRDCSEVYDALGANGAYLRKIAQCHTLRFLIAHANAEIRRFNRRYELEQVKNSLAMRVIDHDRFDDRRDTTSLSGGETFIVSLGLALGLSSLSSRNIMFSNLFIDEGFGTLDPETLSVVLDALASMQSAQGKKVGVISHTDTMAEQIATQIQVQASGTPGVSTIRITSGRERWM